MCVYQVVGHLLNLGDEVGEELGHVLLLPGVQRLLVHGVGLAERTRVVGLALALLHTHTHTHTQTHTHTHKRVCDRVRNCVSRCVRA